MNIKHKNITDFIRIKDNRIDIGVCVIFGQQGSHFVLVAPSIFVSGYGQTEKEAKESFDLNLDLFCSDIHQLSQKERETELYKLGFSRGKYRKKNFSKNFSDNKGILQNFEPGTTSASFVQNCA